MYGVVPPVADVVKATVCPTWGEEGDALIVAESGRVR